MKRAHPTLLAVIAFALASAAPAAAQVDASPDLQAMIDRAIANGDERLVIPPGTYRVKPPAERAPHLRIANAEGLTIIADGVRMICTELNQAIAIDDCRGLTLQGLTIDHDPLPFTQGTVVSVGDDHRVLDIRLDHGYPDVSDRVRVSFWEPDGSRVKAGTWTRYGGSFTPLGPDEHPAAADARVIRFDQGRSFDDGVAVGDRVVMSLRYVTAHGIVLTHCSETVLRDVTVHASTCFAFLERHGDGNVYQRLRVTPGPAPRGATQPRVLSNLADAFHSKFARRGPTIEGCVFEKMGDDGIAINGDFVLVLDADAGADPPTLTVAFKRFPVVDPGDEVLVRNRAELRPIGRAEVLALDPVAPGQGLPQGFNTRAEVERLLPELRERNAFDQTYRLTLDRPIEAERGDILASPDRVGSDFVIRNNTIRNHRARGMLIKSSNGLIADNTVEGSSMSGIVISPEVNLWMEGDFATDVTIRGNTVRNVNTAASNPHSTFLGAITVTSPELTAAGAHRRIRILQNTVHGGKGPALFVASAQDVLIRDNAFHQTHQLPGSHGQAHGLPSEPVIFLTRVRDVTLAGNLPFAPGPYAGPLLRVGDADR